MECSNKIILIVTTALMVTVPYLSAGDGDPSGTTRSITPMDDPEMHPLGFFRGILPNPYPGQDLEEVYENASMHSQFVPVWGRPSTFFNLSRDLNGTWGDLFVDQLIRGNGMFPLVHMSFIDTGMTLQAPDDMADPSLNNPEWRHLYKESALDIVNASRPAYLSLGNEVNRWFDHHGDDPGDDNAFRHFISLYNETYDAVKELSPRTKVFCTFAREIVSENREANLSLLQRFDPDRMDLVVLTTYPHSVMGINRVSDIPDDYYSSVFDQIERRTLGFSEAAWPSLTAFGGEGEQSAFITNITGRLTNTMDLQMVGWPWLHDIGPADATGLRYNDGTEKTSLETWRMNGEPTFNRSARFIDIVEDSGTTVYDLNDTFSDPDDWDRLTYSIFNGTDYTDFSDGGEINASVADHFLTIRTKENATGTVQLQIMAEDIAGESNWTVIQVNIEGVNDPPALLSHETITVREGGTAYLELTGIIVDAEDPAGLLEMNVTSSPHLNVNITVFPYPYIYVYTVDPDWFGSTHIEINVTDLDGASTTVRIPVIYISVEDPPLLELPETIIMEEDTKRTLNTTGWWSDADPGTDLRADFGSSSKIETEYNGSGLEVVPEMDWYGTTHIDITVSDGTHNSSGSVEVIVSPVNDPPRSPNTTGKGNDPLIRIREDETVYFDLDRLSIYDPEGETIIHTIHNSSEKIRTVSFPMNGSMMVVPFPDSNGLANFTIKMSDPSGGESFVRFTIDIAPVNDAPFFMTPDNWTINLKRGDHYEIDLSGAPYVVEDIEDDLYDLVLRFQSDMIVRDGNILIMDISPNAEWNRRTIDFHVEDTRGARSETRTLTIVLSDPLQPNGNLSLDRVEIGMVQGDMVITAEGGTNQRIWAVITYTNRTTVSRIVPEGLSGSYYLRWKGLSELVPAGETIKVHLSKEKGGENDSGMNAWTYTHVPETDEDKVDNNQFPFEVLSLTALVLIAVVILAFYFKNRKKVPEE